MRVISLALAVISLSACGGGDAAPANAPPQEGATPPAAGASEAPAAATPPPPSAAPAAATPPPAASAAATGPKKNDPNEAPLLGKLTEADVQATLSKNFGGFDPCYPSLKKKSADIKVQLKPTIGPSGKVNEALVLKSSGDKKFDACVVDAFKKIQFPASKEGSAYVSPTWIELGGQMVMQK
jgi:TonB family protein